MLLGNWDMVAIEKCSKIKKVKLGPEVNLNGLSNPVKTRRMFRGQEEEQITANETENMRKQPRDVVC